MEKSVFTEGKDPFFVKSSSGGSRRNGERVAKSNESDPKEKRPFDKKKWRLQKYSKKYKMQQWEEKRRTAVLREYHKECGEEKKVDVQKIYEEAEETQNAERVVEEKARKPGPRKAHLEFERIREEKTRKKEEFAKKKVERDAELKQAKKRKADERRKLSKKTKKGQPIMKDRLEMLLQRIQKSLD